MKCVLKLFEYCKCLPVEDHLKTRHTIISSFCGEIEGVLDLEAGDLHLVVQDALRGVRHQGQVVRPVHHLGVVIIEGSHLQ